MTDASLIVETLEHRWMRAWVARDTRTLKALTSADFRLLVATDPPVLLDRTSWLEAAATRYTCDAYHFGSTYARDHGGVAILATKLILQARMDDADWSGDWWLTVLWKKSRFRQKWRLVERVLSRPDLGPDTATSIRSLQLWRPSRPKK